ncbi:hypothetical protein IJM16_03160 [Candidatus Saccharibacteria bacterium]|nr:hypothetical protein [Candidatus Saccharibacteria bacterium]
MNNQEDDSMFHIPVSTLVLEAKKAAITEQTITPVTPVVIEKAFPSYSSNAPELDLYNELSAVSDEVIKCRNSVLSNIY